MGGMVQRMVHGMVQRMVQRMVQGMAQRMVQRMVRVTPLAVLVAGGLIGLCGARLAQAQGAAPSTAAGSVSGVVRTGPPDRLRPVREAAVLIAALKLATRTDSLGRYLLAEVPAGTHTLEIRALGFAPATFTVTVLAGARVEQDALVAVTVNQLAAIATTADGPVVGRLAEFDARRRLGMGKFQTRDYYEKASGRRFADVLLTKTPGLMAISSGGERYLATGNRGSVSMLRMPGEAGKPKECYVQIVVDGLVRYRSTPGERLFNIDSIDPQTVEGTEFYTVSQTPLQFNSTGGASCGTLVIWLRQ